MKAKEKRNPRSYKTTDTVYKRAMKRAKKESTTVAALIEGLLSHYGSGKQIKIFEEGVGSVTVLDFVSEKVG